MGAKKGVPKSATHKANISKALRGRKFSDLHKQHLRDKDYSHLVIHGHASRKHKSPTWISWDCMIDRCNNPNANAFANYGGRGITICSQWLEFSQFLADMGERPIDTTLDRIDNDRNYEPGNCRWADKLTQNRNRKRRK